MRLLSTLAVAVLAFGAPALSHATWSALPVTVQGTTDICSRVAAAPDGAEGAIVVWQQVDAANSATQRLLARHLLANGDLDPAWPVDGAVVSTGTLARGQLGAISDELGGAYVWWTEGASIYVTRLASNGAVAANWPARGRAVGSLAITSRSTLARRPDVRADGQGGLWMGWLTGAVTTTSGRLIHLGPNNTGAGGWPNQARGYAHSDPGVGGPQTLAFAYGPTSDGGAWIAWGDAPLDEAGYHAGAWRVSRVTNSGQYAPGWDGLGVETAAFHGELLGDVPYYACDLVAVSDDGANGAYLFRTDLTNDGATWMYRTLYRLDAAGAPAAGWPVSGVAPSYNVPAWLLDSGPDCSMALLPEPAGAVLAVTPSFSTAGVTVEVIRVSAAGARTLVAGAEEVSQPGSVDITRSTTGDLFVASFSPDGPYGPYSPDAYLRVDQTLASGTKGPGFFEWHPQIASHWFDDMGIAAIGNGSAIFAWSQSNQLHGVFARKLGPNGEITGAPPAGPANASMRLRFAPGRGVVASLPPRATGRLTLIDVSGRTRAAAEVGDGATEVTLAGTERLSPGVYFAMHRGADGSRSSARVVVTR